MNARGMAAFLAALFGSIALALTPHASAQPYPAKPIKLVVTFAAGGGADFVARVIAAKLQRSAGPDRSSSRIAPAPAARSAPSSSRSRRPTVTRCCSAPPGR